MRNVHLKKRVLSQELVTLFNVECYKLMSKLIILVPYSAMHRLFQEQGDCHDRRQFLDLVLMNIQDETFQRECIGLCLLGIKGTDTMTENKRQL